MRRAAEDPEDTVGRRVRTRRAGADAPPAVAVAVPPVVLPAAAPPVVPPIVALAAVPFPVVPAGDPCDLLSPKPLVFTRRPKAHAPSLPMKVSRETFSFPWFQMDEARFRAETPPIMDLNVTRTYSHTTPRHTRGDVRATTFATMLRGEALGATTIMNNHLKMAEVSRISSLVLKTISEDTENIRHLTGLPIYPRGVRSDTKKGLVPSGVRVPAFPTYVWRGLPVANPSSVEKAVHSVNRRIDRVAKECGLQPGDQPSVYRRVVFSDTDVANIGVVDPTLQGQDATDPPFSPVLNQDGSGFPAANLAPDPLPVRGDRNINNRIMGRAALLYTTERSIDLSAYIARAQAEVQAEGDGERQKYLPHG